MVSHEKRSKQTRLKSTHMDSGRLGGDIEAVEAAEAREQVEDLELHRNVELAEQRGDGFEC